jgi:hypothetical protein
MALGGGITSLMAAIPLDPNSDVMFVLRQALAAIMRL